MDALLPAIEVETAAQPWFSVIWMHGLGADGSDFEAVVPELGLDDCPGIRFVFPHAPLMPVTCNGGFVMRAWYDIVSLDSSSRSVDAAGVVRSRQAIRHLIARENQRGVPCSRIVLAGFSQGGAVAYTTALTQPEALAGVIALSTYIPTPKLLDDEATDANRTVPVFAAHGSEDDVVSLELGLDARDFLTRRGYPVAWHEYPMAHTVCIEEIEEIGRWLRARFGMLELKDIDLRGDPAAAPYVKTEVVDVTFAAAEGELVSLEGPNRYHVGDALITGSTGNRWSVARSRFDLKYAAVPPTGAGQDGRYQARPTPVLAKQIAMPFTARRCAGGDVLHGKAGDWLLQYGPGDFGIAENGRFVQVYKPFRPAGSCR